MGSRDAPASVGQRMLWLLDRHRGEHGALNYPVLWRLRGPLDLPALRRALDLLTARHETLRTTFARRRGLLTQVVNEPAPVAIRHGDLRCATDPAAATRDAVARELRCRVDPAEWPLRVSLWRLRDEEHVLCLNAHHLVTDAWSCGILLRDLLQLLRRPDVALPRVAWQHRHFAIWERRLLAGDGLATLREHWRERLAGIQLPALPLAPEPSRTAVRRAGTAGADVGSEVADGLRRLARDRRTTLFTVMLAVYGALLRRLTGQTDLAVASLFANRARPEVMDTVGFFANMVVLRLRMDEDAGFGGLLASAGATVADALVHQQLPYHLLPAGCVSVGGRRADDVVFQMLPELPRPALAGPVETEVLLPEVAARFDLELALVPRDGGFRVLLQYAEDRVDPVWAAELVAAYVALATTLATGDDAPL